MQRLRAPLRVLREESPDSLFRVLARTQGAYFVATGVWPLVHMRSFEAVTGPKTDKWLVKVVGALVAVAGAVMLRGAVRGESSEEVALLAASSAAALGALETSYALKGRIAPVYLLDAVAEAGLVAAWAAWWRREQATRRVVAR